MKKDHNVKKSQQSFIIINPPNAHPWYPNIKHGVQILNQHARVMPCHQWKHCAPTPNLLSSIFINWVILKLSVVALERFGRVCSMSTNYKMLLPFLRTKKRFQPRVGINIHFEYLSLEFIYQSVFIVSKSGLSSILLRLAV